jgi:hypothetical protein
LLQERMLLLSRVLELRLGQTGLAK